MKTRKFWAVFTACLLCVCTLLMSGAATAEENAVTFAVVDSVGTPGTVRETADKLIDGRDDTKWGVFYNEGDTVSVTLKASEPIVVGGYALTTGSDNRTYKGRNPKDWTLFGSNDYDEEKKTGTWTAVHAVENDTVLPDRNKESFVYSFDNETAYSYYKFEVTANKGDDYMQLSELTFLYGFEGDVAFVGVDGKNTNDKEGYANLFDRKKSRLFFSKWCVSVGDGAYVVARAAKPTVVTGYTFTTGPRLIGIRGAGRFSAATIMTRPPKRDAGQSSTKWRTTRFWKAKILPPITLILKTARRTAIINWS